MIHIISLEGFTEEETGRLHHDFMMLLKDQIKGHFESIVEQGIKLSVSDDEDDIRFIKIDN
jgi:hypothetical protein